MSETERLSRRGFIKATAAVAAFPYLIAGSVHAAAGKPAPSERITMGTIGYGNQAPGDVGAFMGMGDVQFVACCDVKQWRLDEVHKRLADKYGAGVQAYHAFEELIARDDIDAIHMAVPDHWHATMAIAAMKAGKDVYCQKPLSLTIGEAWTMVATARRLGRVLQTGSQQRSSSEFLKACEYVRNHRIGDITQVNVNVGGPSGDKLFVEQPIPDGFDWDRWLGPAPWMPYNEERCSGDYSGGWRQVRDYSGGLMTDWGAHHFDIAQWGLGMDGSGPSEIVPPTLSPEKHLTYYYPETPVGKNVKVIHQAPANGVRFIGTKGTIEVNRGYISCDPVTIFDEPLGVGDVRLYHSTDHYRNFIDCVRTREKPIADVEVGASSVTVCHLGNIAHWTGRSFHWDPKTRQITDDPELNRWLDRPKRAPWHL